jgi:hypothetical protein
LKYLKTAEVVADVTIEEVVVAADVKTETVAKDVVVREALVLEVIPETEVTDAATMHQDQDVLVVILNLIVRGQTERHVVQNQRQSPVNPVFQDQDALDVNESNLLILSQNKIQKQLVKV